jgi:hypothetical protein
MPKTKQKPRTPVRSTRLVRASRSCKGCYHYRWFINECRPNVCTHLDHAANNPNRCKDYNPNGMPWPL